MVFLEKLWEFNGILSILTMSKFICKNCNKEYEVDLSLGNWQKDNTQQHIKNGVKADTYCCYECGKQYRKKIIQQSWKNKSAEELIKIKEKRKNGTKPKKCKVCGKEFIPNSIGAKHNVYLCSDECRNIYYNKYSKSGIKICQECGKSYTYIENQGNWDKNNNLVKCKGLGHSFTIRSDRYCCYECGIKHKENLRKEKNLEKYGYISPFQNEEKRQEIYIKLKNEGKLFTSSGEKEILTYIKSLGFNPTKYILGNGLSDSSKRFEIDIYIPELKIGIEYNGVYYHSLNGKKEGNINTVYHYNKSKVAEQLGIDLIHIWEDQWLNQKDLVKTILAVRLGKLQENRIYARNCKIKEISVEEYKNFCIKNHIQGYKKASIKLGLFYQNTLVQIASFNKVTNMGKAVKTNKKYDYEWVRGCPASNTVIIGGTSKLFKYFIKNYNPTSVLCYADWNLFNGNGYKQCGFIFDGYTGPDKFYIQAKPILRINRNPYMYKEFKKLVLQKKLWVCYGAGSLRFIWNKPL